jgi:hypothetical protein
MIGERRMSVIKTMTGIVIVGVITLSVSSYMLLYQANIEKKSKEFTGCINAIPETFGLWKRTSEEPLPDYAELELKVKGCKVWTYTNTMTGEKVSVFVMVGPTGRLSVHTPEICIGSDNTIPAAPRVPVKIAVEDEKAGECTFWNVRFNLNMNANYQRLFYYAMGTGKEWYAVENPRFEFAKYPLMLRIQVEAIVPKSNAVSKPDEAEKHAGSDVVFQFLQEFLPELDKVVGDHHLL